MKLQAGFSSQRFAVASAAMITLAAWACYAASLTTPFVFDGVHHLRDNPAIRTLWPAWEWLAFAQTRPVGYLTFALNYALDGNNVVGYHVVNVLIHNLTALLLFDLVRRTLRPPGIAERLRKHADWAALAVALLWVAHPICTQAVTYIYQRLESLAALWCLASLWAFVRAYEPTDAKSKRNVVLAAHANRWKIVSTAACLLALLTKESAFCLPLVILWYDRVFLAKSWQATASRRRFYASLCICWGVLAALVFANTAQYEKAGLMTVRGVSPLDYALSQPGVVLHYVRLTIWPTGQCIDYGWPVTRDFWSIVPPLFLIGIVVIATFVGLGKGRAWSFLLGAFFLLLAPTSSIMPIADLAFEHRMYLPSACLIAAIVCAAVVLGERFAGATAHSPRSAIRFAGIAAAASAVVALGTATVVRNRVYRSEFDLWTDVVEKAPQNARGHASLAGGLLARGDREAARAGYERAVELAPDYTIALLNLASMHAEEQRFDEAEALLARAHESNPGYTQTLHTYGMVRAAQGRAAEAERYYLEALEADPYNWAAMNQLGLLYYECGQLDRAVEFFRRSSEIAPYEAPPVANLGVCLCRAGRYAEALPVFRHAIALDPRHVDAWANLGSALDHAGKPDDALGVLHQAVELFPDHAGCRLNLANVLSRNGRAAEATEHYRAVLAMDPEHPEATRHLATDLVGAP